MNGIPDTCNRCGADSVKCVFTDYEPAPNEDQQETDWAPKLDPLKAIVCPECAYVYGVFDPNDLDHNGRSAGGDYKVEGELR